MSPPLQESRPLLRIANRGDPESDPDPEEGQAAPQPKKVASFRLSNANNGATSSTGPPLSSPASLLTPWKDRMPPEWAVLLLGCFIGLATGASVVLFNLTVHGIHHLAWAGTPTTGAAWLRVQHLSDTWHRILLIPVVGGVVVGMLHGISKLVDSSTGTSENTPRPSAAPNPMEAARPFIKAVQAAVTLGTGASLGPEGPSVDIGTAWASGLADVLQNSPERKVALVAAGAASGIAAGFNAAIAGCFFAVETILRSTSGEVTPSLTISITILAAVLSSTVTRVFLGEAPAFTVPEYELRSAAELPLYFLLGVLCGVASYVLTRLIAWFEMLFELLKQKTGVPDHVTPALGALLCGFIALKYPGVLYWGFENVDEILHSRTSPTAPGPKLLLQLVAAKLLATAICRGSGLVGGIYAPSLLLGAALGSAYGSIAGGFVDIMIPGPSEIAAPQAYALVGMAAMLAGACQVPLTAILLLFELTQDYRVMLPLCGAVGLSTWVASTAMKKDGSQPAAGPVHGAFDDLAEEEPEEMGIANGWHGDKRRKSVILRSLLSIGNDQLGGKAMSWLGGQGGPALDEQMLEEVKVQRAMNTGFVAVLATKSVKEVIETMVTERARACLVVDAEQKLEGILTLSDLWREAQERQLADEPRGEVESLLASTICSRSRRKGVKAEEEELVTVSPETSIHEAICLMVSHRVRQLPVIARGNRRWQEQGGQSIVGMLYWDDALTAARAEATRRALLSRPD